MIKTNFQIYPDEDVKIIATKTISLSQAIFYILQLSEYYKIIDINGTELIKPKIFEKQLENEFVKIAKYVPDIYWLIVKSKITKSKLIEKLNEIKNPKT